MLIHHIVLAATSNGLQGLADNALGLISKIGGVALVAFVGLKAIGHIAKEEFAKAIGLFVIALIPALFLIEPNTAQSLLTSTLHAIGG